MGRKNHDDQEMDDAVESIVEEINGSEMMETGVARSRSIAFLERIITECHSIAAPIRQELKEDGEGVEDDEDEGCEDDEDD